MSFTLTAVARAGAFLNFDLAYPSQAIPDDFFPSDEALYGYTVSRNHLWMHCLLTCFPKGFWCVEHHLRERSLPAQLAGRQRRSRFG